MTSFTARCFTTSNHLDSTLTQCLVSPPRRTQMPRVLLVELTLCKETDDKVRWDALIDDAKFSLYIPKWRVPSPWPNQIRVSIAPIEDDAGISASHISQERQSGSPSVVRTRIDAIVEKKSFHTKTVRYDPVGIPHDWEIGSPYIPHSLTHDKANKLRLFVEWIDLE